VVRPKFDEGGNKTALSALAKTAVHPSDCIKLYSNRYPCINPFFLLKVLLFLFVLLLLLLLFVTILLFCLSAFFLACLDDQKLFEEREEETFLFRIFRSEEVTGGGQEMVGTNRKMRGRKTKTFCRKKVMLL